ncbi:MAG: hypothetical protein JO325_10910 [Solirubrobacterales bacterium]|nr:hypothetical protein [Solirubrobacterales bacterium]
MTEEGSCVARRERGQRSATRASQVSAAGQAQTCSRTCETLTDEDRDAISTGFDVPASDLFVSTEGLVGRGDPGSKVLTFASDNCIVELVDHDNKPVQDGVACAKVLVTNLHNLTQPLIRYELTDEFIAHPSIAGSGHLHATVQGRADTTFRYGRIELHPHAIRSTLTTASTVREYQIRQTPRGLHAAIIGEGDLDTDAITVRLRETLAAAGLTAPEITVQRVDEIERDPETGKTRRFIPLTT